MSQIDHLTGIEFENYLKALFEKMGYTVERDFNLNKFSGIRELHKEYQRHK